MYKKETQGAVEIIAPAAALTHEQADELVAAIAQRPAGGQPLVVIDLGQVPLVDSAGLESLLEIQQSVRQSGGSLKLAAPSQLCEEIFRITGVCQQLDTYPDVKAAVRSFVR